MLTGRLNIGYRFNGQKNQNLNFSVAIGVNKFAENSIIIPLSLLSTKKNDIYFNKRLKKYPIKNK